MDQHIPEANTGPKLLDSVCRPVFFISAGLIVLVCAYGVGFSEHAAVTFSAIQNWLVTNFGWFYMVSILSLIHI